MTVNSGYLTGVVLQTRSFRESDKLISFYSQECGKIEILVRGGRKIKSKLAPIISEPFALLALKVVEGKGYYHLIGGLVKERFKNISNDYEKISQVSNLFLRLNTLLKFRKPDDKILSLISKFLRKINQLPGEKTRVISSAFLIKFLTFLGYRPEIRHCLICRRIPQEKELFFNLDKGGIICPPDAQSDSKRAGPPAQAGQENNGENNQDNQNIKISQNVLIILQKMLYRDFDFLIKQNLNQRDRQIAERIIDKFCQWHMG